MSKEFSWDPRGEAFWLEAQKTSGATDLQVRFACCRARGMTATGAARAAGYGGDDDNIRQAGHRAAKSTAVMNMLALAQAETAGGDDGTVGPAEARRILSRLARGSDPSVVPIARSASRAELLVLQVWEAYPLPSRQLVCRGAVWKYSMISMDNPSSTSDFLVLGSAWEAWEGLDPSLMSWAGRRSRCAARGWAGAMRACDETRSRADHQ
jgi:hypothetical protein